MIRLTAIFVMIMPFWIQSAVQSRLIKTIRKPILHMQLSTSRCDPLLRLVECEEVQLCRLSSNISKRNQKLAKKINIESTGCNQNIFNSKYLH
jgi:hypothetical protein